MPTRRKAEQTGDEPGSAASRIMRGKARRGDAKKVAASALTQRPNKRKKKAKAKAKRKRSKK